MTTVNAGLTVNNGLVKTLVVVMFNTFLHESGMTSTWHWVDQLAKEQLEKKRQEGEQVTAPKL